MAFFSGSLFASEKKRERKKKEEMPSKIFFAGKASAADGRAQRLFPGRVYGFLFWFSFLSPERKENKPSQNKTKQNSGRGFVWLALRMESAGMIGTTEKNQSYRSIGFH